MLKNLRLNPEVPIGNSLLRNEIEEFRQRLREMEPERHRSYDKKPGCFFCGSSSLYRKDYCKRCYRDFILGLND